MRKQDEEIHGFYNQNSQPVFSGLEFVNCTFVGCGLIAELPFLRPTVRASSWTNCKVTGCAIHTAIFDDCVVDGLKTSDLLPIYGSAFRHVVLRGNIGRIMIGPALPFGIFGAWKAHWIQRANTGFYKTVDWAIDIRDARFSECDIRSIPARLVRRDPETQVVLRREHLLDGKWKALDLSHTYWKTSIEFFLERGDPDVVLVAPKASRNFQALLDGLHMLRQAGIAEQD